MRAKFITVKGPEHLADEPFYVGVLQHERTMSRREAYEYIAEKTGYKPAAIRAVFDPERNALELALRLDEGLRLSLADATATIVTDLALAWIAAGAKRAGVRFRRGADLS